jgi:hypothetical protein
VALPKGLDETIDAFNKGCDAKNRTVSPEVRPQITERFRRDYQDNEGDWDAVSGQVLTIARLAGRLAALYAELDGKTMVEWVHARFGLRDARSECQQGLGAARGKHCQSVDLDTP